MNFFRRIKAGFHNLPLPSKCSMITILGIWLASVLSNLVQRNTALFAVCLTLFILTGIICVLLCLTAQRNDHK